MEAGKLVRSRMKECEHFKGKWPLYRWLLPENGKEIEKFDRIPTDKTYLIPLEKVENATVYKAILHDPSHPRYLGGTTASLNILKGTEPLNDNAFRAGASFFAEISATFGKTGTPPEFETNEIAEKDEGETKVKNSNVTSDKQEKKHVTPITVDSDEEDNDDDDDDVLVIDEEPESIAELENDSNSQNSVEVVQILDDESHMPVIDNKNESPNGKATRRPSLNIISDNSIKMIFDKSNHINKDNKNLQKEPESIMLQSVAEKKQNKENENQTKKNETQSNEKKSILDEEIANFYDEIENISKKTQERAPDDVAKENVLARLALQYDLDDNEENSNSSATKEQTEADKNENTLTGNRMTFENKLEKTPETESRIKNVLSKVVTFENSLENRPEMTENRITETGSEIADSDIRKNSIIPKNVLENEDNMAINKDCEHLAIREVSENLEKEDTNERTETKVTETRNEEEYSLSVRTRTVSDEIMTFHKGTEDTKESKTTKKVSRNKKVYKIIRKKASKKRSKSSQQIILKENERSVEKNNCPSNLQALIEAEVEALMRTTIMKELQKSIVNKILQESKDLKDINPKQNQETQSASENHVVSVSSEGLFSPSLFPVEEVSTENFASQNPSNISPPIAHSQIVPSRCGRDSCMLCQNNVNNNISHPPPPTLLVSSNISSQHLNLATVQSSETDGLFYSDIQVLKSNSITLNEIENFAKNLEKNSKPSRKRKSTENEDGDKGKKSKAKKQAENMNNKARGNSRKNNNKTTSALQLIGLDNINAHHNLNNHEEYNNNGIYQRRNDLRIISPDLNCQLTTQLNYNSFAGGQRNSHYFPNHNIPKENQPNTVYHYFPAQQQIIPQNNHSKENMRTSPNLPVPSYQPQPQPQHHQSLPQPQQPQPPSPCVQQPLHRTTAISRQQMLYEQISPPVNLSTNVQQGNIMDLTNNRYDNNSRLLFLTPGDHQEYLARQQLASRLSINSSQHLQPNLFLGQPTYPPNNYQG